MRSTTTSSPASTPRWREAHADDEIKVVVLTGAGRAFSAGFDIAPEAAWASRAADAWREELAEDVDVTMRLLEPAEADDRRRARVVPRRRVRAGDGLRPHRRSAGRPLRRAGDTVRLRPGHTAHAVRPRTYGCYARIPCHPAGGPGARRHRTAEMAVDRPADAEGLDRTGRDQGHADRRHVPVASSAARRTFGGITTSSRDWTSGCSSTSRQHSSTRRGTRLGVAGARPGTAIGGWASRPARQRRAAASAARGSGHSRAGRSRFLGRVKSVASRRATWGDFFATCSRTTKPTRISV